jgi:hypothetical protein
MKKLIVKVNQVSCCKQVETANLQRLHKKLRLIDVKIKSSYKDKIAKLPSLLVQSNLIAALLRHKNQVKLIISKL